MTTERRTGTAAGRIQRRLADGWALTLEGGLAGTELPDTIAATVPGTVHTDLLAAGLIPDPYLDTNEHTLAWIGLCDWRYSVEFDWQPGGLDRAELVFDGIDTIAEIDLNGTRLGRSVNQHRSHRFDVSGLLQPGANRLSVVLRSPIRAADAASSELGYRPHANHHPYNAIRKAAYSFGWDWGIDTSTSGIWRDVRLEEWATARITSVRLVPTVDDGQGRVVAHADLAHADPAGDAEGLALIATVTGPDGVRHGSTVPLASRAPSGAVEVTIDAPELWWPVGHGEQPLYELDVRLVRDEATLDTAHRRFGFRTVRLDMGADEEGTSFVIVVNDRPVFVKGANWIPDDAFLPRVTPERYARRLDQAASAGINLLRVWGGGIYESDDFFDGCDERGILTWQDFLLACAAYSEDEPLRSEIEAEAREAVGRLSSHPSLVLFNGNNENVWGYEEWGWPQRLDGRSWGELYYFEIFPAVVADLAPHVAYTHASPFSPSEGYPGAHAQNDPAHATAHIWDIWNQRDWRHYRDYRPRFVAEFGWQGPPTWTTLTDAVHDEPLTPESPGMITHQKAVHGNQKLTDGLLPHLRMPDDMADWHWAMQLNQADAVRTAIEHFRSLQPHCMGSIVWQLNDCWPVTSWAAVDGAGREKPLFHALRIAHADRLLTVQPRGGGLAVVAVNDTDEEWRGELRCTRLHFDGGVLAEQTSPVVVPPRGAVTTELPPSLDARDPSREVLRATLGEHRAEWFFDEHRRLDLPKPGFTAELQASGDVHRLTVTATTLLAQLTLLVDKAAPDATVDAGLVTLLAGESTTFEIGNAPAEIGLVELTAPDVLRTVNQLVAPSPVR
ncbi:glycoside hydrolase family 2 protein [Microbacterium sp. 179-B 1A2 NHS]|uniref:beta-mannosidase n=1 Tax=Microbacterium sp. 179-B 1A2 NHS TaxID=3142383 RepID=UPI0039A03DBE